MQALENTEHRSLAAIMFTDMVGYSALAQKDETLALRLLEAQRSVVRSTFPKHGGKEIKTMGDGFLVQFRSALAASLCAVEIQTLLAERNTKCPEDQRLNLRIGVHLGDVVHREGDVFGDGVNIAARLEPLAPPGGICISEDVARQIHNKIEQSVITLGRVELKNIQRQMEVFHIIVSPENKGHTLHFTTTEQKSVAVLPFVNMSADRENEFLSDGITEDLITAFSQVEGLRVPARTSAFAFKGRNEDIRRVPQANRPHNLTNYSPLVTAPNHPLSDFKLRGYSSMSEQPDRPTVIARLRRAPL